MDHFHVGDNELDTESIQTEVDIGYVGRTSIVLKRQRISLQPMR